MAVAASNISQVQYNQSKLSISGFAIEHWRIASGQAQGDTAVITPAREKLIKGVMSGQVNNLPATGASSVTITLPAVAPGSTVVTATIGQVDIFIICQPR